jgi:hypothetical protein
MAQMNWVYLDNAGKSHRVGMYHGNKTGHVLIYCDLKVVQVDFSVKETTYYSFFIEEELCEVHIVREKDGWFGYEFKINKKIDTPLNQRRKSVLRSERKQFAVGIGIMLLFIGCLLVFNQYQRQKRITDSTSERSILGLLNPSQVRQLQQRGLPCTATFVTLEENGRPIAYYKIKAADSTIINGKVENPNGGKIYLPSGYVLGNQHTFKGQYLPENPIVHRVNFYAPDSTTIKAYTQEAIQIDQLLHPEKNTEYSRCLADAILLNRNWQSLVTMIHQNDGADAKNSYLRLVRDPDIARMIKINCGLE